MYFKALISQVLILFTFWIKYTVCYPDGPPIAACEDMQPRVQMGELGLEGHTEPDQSKWPTMGRSSLAPYYITVNHTDAAYTPGDVYTGMYTFVYMYRM